MYIPQEIAENYLSACRTKAALPLGLALFFLYLGAVLLWRLRRERAQGDE